ncbi:MAG: hypothetical protein U1E29_06785 [Coriobacteriia bacterium]|nr:hypothetical protein [Coriobacteriia bacterium]
MKPSDFFPSIPQDVREWLDERASYLGWPPAGDEWYGVLRGLSLATWQRLEWERRVVALDPATLTGDTKLIVSGLYDAVFDGVQNEYSGLGCSQQKIAEIIEYVRANNELPGVLIFLEGDDGLLDVVDGCHRLALYFALCRQMATQQVLGGTCDAWVGRIGSSSAEV